MKIRLKYWGMPKNLNAKTFHTQGKTTLGSVLSKCLDIFWKTNFTKNEITPDTNFKSISYNLFTKNDNCVNTKSNPDIYFFRYISALDTKYFN